MKALLLSLCLAGILSGYKPETEDGILLYRNYSDVIVNVPLSNSASNTASCNTDSIIGSVECLKGMKNAKKISGTSFNALINQDIINEWYFYQSLETYPFPKSRIDFIKSKKQEISLYNLGKLLIDNRYDSYLILAIYEQADEYANYRSLFLVNSDEDQLRSISRVARYTHFDGTCMHLSCRILKDRVMLLKEEIVCSDALGPDMEFNPERCYSAKFIFDQSGFLRMLK